MKVLLGVAVAIFVFVVTPTMGAIVNLSIVNNAAGQWQAFATVNPDGTPTLGLHGIEFDVLGSGGLSVTGSVLNLPSPTETTDFSNFVSKGFVQNVSPGTVVAGSALDLRGNQENVNRINSSGTGNNNILEQVGLAPFTETNGLLPAFNGTNPILIGSGTFSGTAGALTVVSLPTLVTLLPGTLPTATAGGASFSTFSPTLVNNGSFVLAPVPEPSSLTLLAIGAAVVGWAVKRRRLA